MKTSDLVAGSAVGALMWRCRAAAGWVDADAGVTVGHQQSAALDCGCRFGSLFEQCETREQILNSAFADGSDVEPGLRWRLEESTPRF